MSLTTMYPAANNSPSTVLTADLSSSGTTMTVDDPSVLPAAPNLAVLGTSDNAEIVLYTEISGNDLTIVRGQNGTTPGTWNSETTVARNFTAADHEAFRENILDLENRKQEKLTFDDTPTSGSSNPVKSGGVYSELSGKQSTLTFDNTPTQNSNNPVKSGGVYSALVEGFRDVYKVTLPSASSSKKSFTASGITSSHVMVVEGYAYFSNSAAVTSNLTLTTGTNSITITGTLSGTTDIVVTLGIPRTITAS